MTSFCYILTWRSLILWFYLFINSLVRTLLISEKASIWHVEKEALSNGITKSYEQLDLVRWKNELTKSLNDQLMASLYRSILPLYLLKVAFSSLRFFCCASHLLLNEKASRTRPTSGQENICTLQIDWKAKSPGSKVLLLCCHWYCSFLRFSNSILFNIHFFSFSLAKRHFWHGRSWKFSHCRPAI